MKNKKIIPVNTEFYAAIDNDTKEIVSCFQFKDTIERLINDLNKECREFGGSSTQYGIISLKEYEAQYLTP